MGPPDRWSRRDHAGVTERRVHFTSTNRATGGGEHHAQELTIAELETERTELLPTRETLTFGFGNTNWAAIFASNSSLALNAASLGSAGQQRRRADDRRHPGLMPPPWPHRGGPRARVRSRPRPASKGRG